MEVELNLNHKKSISRVNIFIYTLIVVFLLTIIQSLIPDFKTISFQNPLSKKTSVLNNITPKLQKIANDFKVKTENSIIEPTLASSYFNDTSSYAVVDYETGEVIAEKNLSKKLPVASLTKIMTAIVTLDLTGPSELITITQRAANEQPTKIGVVSGQKMTVEELLNALLLTSANDAARALEDGINKKYGAEIFIDAMNKKASAIGLSDSFFTNSQGFDYRGNHSSTKDLAIIARYALKNYPLISQIVAKDYQFYPANKNHKQFDLYNWNGLLGVYPGTIGVKIGNTDDAGFTTTVVSQRADKKLIVVLLGAPGVLERDLWTAQLLDYSFKKTEGLEPITISEYDLKQKYSTWKYWN